MAAETEGIALLSMYNDEEDEEDSEDGHHQYHNQHEQQQTPIDKDHSTEEDCGVAAELEKPSPPSREASADAFEKPLTNSPIMSEEDVDLKTLASPAAPTPPPPRVAQLSQTPSTVRFPSPAPTPPLPHPSASTLVLEAVSSQSVRRGSLTIVDYGHDDGHDDAVMTPDHEDDELIGRVVISTELQVSKERYEDRSQESALASMPITQPSQPSDLLEQPKSETTTTMDFGQMDPQGADVEMANIASEEMQTNVDPLSNFLPPPTTAKCPDELQEKINKFLAYKRAGKSFNAEVRNRKDYRNPDFLQHAVRYQDIDQIGTCFSKDVFDPHGYDRSDYYDEIEADMRREMESKEQERKKSQKVEFVSGGAQPGIIVPALKSSTQIQATSVLPSNPSGDARENRQGKKSKWDKVDSDVKNSVHSGGQDILSNLGVHAAHLSAASAGTGYSAFAQQKRKEAEDTKMSERKFDRRSN